MAPKRRRGDDPMRPAKRLAAPAPRHRPTTSEIQDGDAGVARQNDRLAVQVLDYPQQPDRDLDTGDLDATFHSLLANVLVLGTPLTDDDVYVQTVAPGTRPIPLPHIPESTCYRNALLGALFNISPFLNFLRQAAAAAAAAAAAGGEPRNVMIRSLGQMADISRDSLPGETQPNRRDRLNGPTAAFWADLTTRLPPENRYKVSFSRGAWKPKEAANDPAEFASYVFDRIVTRDLVEDQAGPDGRLLSPIFERLFQIYMIPRAPYRCTNCGAEAKRRTDDDRFRDDGGGRDMLELRVAKPTELRDAIAAVLWDRPMIPTTVECAVCSQKIQTDTYFRKFAYLPEVLTIVVSYIRDDGITNAAGGRVMYPETLDLSRVRDDPTRDGDQKDCTYKLQSMITSPNAPIGDSEGHFKACVRQSDAEWRVLDDTVQNPSKQVARTLNAIRGDSYRPRMFYYVRERTGENRMGGSIRDIINKELRNTDSQEPESQKPERTKVFQEVYARKGARRETERKRPARQEPDRTQIATEAACRKVARQEPDPIGKAQQAARDKAAEREGLFKRIARQKEARQDAEDLRRAARRAGGAPSGGSRKAGASKGGVPGERG